MFINSDLIFIGLITYLIGSIPFGLLVSKFAKQEDPRMVGSKNIGATNLLRIGGWKLGFLTLILDVTKGFIPIYLINVYNKEEFLGIAILSIILGHLYPIWLKFRGGKGIAALIGILMAYNLNLFYIFIFTWLFCSIISKYSSLSALIAVLITYLTILKLGQIQLIFFIVCFLIVLKHKPNIERLVKGKESKIKLKKKN